ncbi:hypothetical protein H9L10_11310 [Phycicoccus endophyticus]|uniref:LapA family protein n=1 Tax=Phycicoccus endophyticus TaxID=1690220 RepID=A0A7G9QZT7_9MICO|nr:hypothetical protein [Phycicoccus endophyticus]NHI20061.1 hypothetical protein [Phycicoccus endophyticus]QNN48862.1 hypothetical protein H9L10_11310 [Phycicoccus endophyticus]GGL42225.1 hypothetical protein GCM10012283_26020 [Phycicoccus endophyticus]
MVLLGVVLVLLGLGLGALLVAGSVRLDDPVPVHVLGGTIELPPVVFLVSGMVVISIFWLGWVVLRTGLKRGHRRRVEAREARKAAEEERLAQEQRMKEEVEARERALEAERRRHEEETARLRQEAEQRVAEQHVATETARRRAEVAEARTEEEGPAPEAPR